VCAHVVSLTGRERPRVCLLPTASGDRSDVTVSFYAALAPVADASHIELHGVPPRDLRDRLLGVDAICVTGGNTANLLAVWRVHGVDAVLREAWEGGAVLWGSSAGMLCWFECGVTDSFGPELDPLHDGLGWLAGSACPHYDGEERRRPVYTSLVAAGFPAGYAADDGAGLVFDGTRLAEVVTVRAGATAYRVEAGGDGAVETPLEAHLLA
jgi:dipeptidase E